MNISGSGVLILGGSGLVGMAIARELFPHRPAKVVISGLTRAEAEQAVGELAGEAGDYGVEVVASWGDIFVPVALKDRRRGEVMADPQLRGQLLDDLYAASPADAVERSALGALLLEHRPGIVIDCINTATVFAYQNVYASVTRLRGLAVSGELDLDTVESHLATLYLPQLIRHVQIAVEAMNRADTRMYLKVGTAGTGGMGLNIPFTHSEERPSKMLLAKASVAGAHSLLLYLMARTPGGPAVKEIKPTAAISWKRIGFGDVMRGGRPVRRVDASGTIPVEETFSAAECWTDTGEVLRGVYVDAGENGLFSPPEFEALTALGLMEFITPEEIARDVAREVLGYPTGRDIVAALDASTSGPTYRAGVMRQHALARMDELERQHGVECVAYEMLGPPRLSKLLFEAAILSRLCDGELRAVSTLDAERIASAAAEQVHTDEDLRTRILSIGIPILLPDGRQLLRGAEVKVRPEPGEQLDPERLAENGWVDLRASNWDRWRERAVAMLGSVPDNGGADGGSRHDIEAWQIDGRIRPGSMAAWVFRHEDRGERVKR